MPLLEAGLSPAQVLDYWVTLDTEETHGAYTQQEWADVRYVSRQAVSDSVVRVRGILDEGVVTETSRGISAAKMLLTDLSVDGKRTVMAMRVASRLQEFFEHRTNGTLRSIVIYELDDFEIVYLRDDVAEQYTESELEDAIDDSRMESMTAPIYANTFSADHGALTCMVKCFETVIEMNFVLADGVGVAVALDVEAFAEAHGLVSEAREIIIEERG